MSVDYYFACKKCNECTHVAQDGLSGFTFYSGEPDCMEKLGHFLRDHSLCGEVHMVTEFEGTDDMEKREWSTEGKPADEVNQ